MFLRQGIKAGAVVYDSRWVLLISGLWSLAIVIVHDFMDYDVIALPPLPVTTIGIVVSLYLGFKSTSAYDRWWEARTIWGDIVNDSRIWANQVINLVDPHKGEVSSAGRALVHRHLAWVNALGYQLRKTSRLQVSQRAHVFEGRRPDLQSLPTGSPACYERYLSAPEASQLKSKANPATLLIRNQGDALRCLFDEQRIDTYRFVALMQTLNDLYASQGKCERIKNTPFPWQFTYFGRMFSWTFILMLPLAFVDIFQRETAEHELTGWVFQEYMLLLVPFTVLVSWIFFLLEKVSESCEDPFEWGTTDVPISSLTRTIEIDIRQMFGDSDVPKPVEPVDGVLY